MRLGVYGGSFDPVHLGHLLLAEAAREHAELDQVLFIPACHSPLKPSRPQASDAERCEMLQRAIAGQEAFSLSMMELQRGDRSFTVDTLQTLRDQQPEAELFLLVGGDSVADFANWRAPERILTLATVLAVNRGRDTPAWPTSLAPLHRRFPDRLQFVSMPGVDISSTDIRERLRSGRSIRYQTPRAVELYLQTHGLYR